ncbi:hypothetical protein DFH06DRAFT_1423373 [Mycena polygramma]|nr:hypothetical protein DFH06DRAFT_1423373 [Mycena polygramma]
MLSPVHTDRARVAELEAEITLLEVSPSARNALLDEKMRVHARLHAVKYPVLTVTLPNEIISEIFSHFLPIYPLCPPLVGLHSPTILTHICCHWREIALSTPSLWRAMSFFGRKTTFHNRICRRETTLVLELQLSKLWLRRSRALPLAISIDYRCSPVSKIFEVIVPHRPRWEHIEFSIADSDLPTIVGPMPLLQYLSVELTVDEPSNTVPIEILDVPRLRTAVLSEGGTFSVALPWGQLTCLVLNAVQQHEYVPILRQTPNLRQCDLSMRFIDSNPRHEIILPWLEALTLNETHNQMTATRIPDTFVVPALRSLQIPEFFLGRDPVDALRSFISTAGCTLQSVHIPARRLIDINSFCEAFKDMEVFFDDWHPESNSSDEEYGTSLGT